MKLLILFSIGVYLSWNFIDLNAESILESKLAPILFVFFLIALLIKIVFIMHFRGIGHPDNTGINDGINIKPSTLNSDSDSFDI